MLIALAHYKQIAHDVGALAYFEEIFASFAKILMDCAPLRLGRIIVYKSVEIQKI